MPLRLSLSSFLLFITIRPLLLLFFFFFNDPATTEIYPLPLPAAFPIYGQRRQAARRARRVAGSRPDEEHRVSRRWLDGRLEARREHRAERPRPAVDRQAGRRGRRDRKSTRLNSSHQIISYAVFCLKKQK